MSDKKCLACSAVLVVMGLCIVSACCYGVIAAADWFGALSHDAWSWRGYQEAVKEKKDEEERQYHAEQAKYRDKDGRLIFRIQSTQETEKAP